MRSAWLVVLGLCAVVTGQTPQTVYTTDGDQCAFPFTYRENTYTTCTDAFYNNEYWCSLDTAYSGNWGDCAPRTDIVTTSGETCTFPFTFQGEMYFACTTAGSVDGQYWCSTVENFVIGQDDYAHCLDNIESTTTTTTTTTEGPSTTQSGAGGSTTVSASSPVGGGGGCTDTFEYIPNQLSYQGDLLEDANTLVECQTACLAMDTCVAFDINPTTNKCWSHTEATIGNVNTNAPSLDQYRRQPCETTVAASTTSAGCVDTFQEYPNTLSYDGELIGTANTLEACMAACLERTDCTFFDFTTTSRCFLHDAADSLADKTNADSVTQYVRIYCAATSSPAQTAANPSTTSAVTQVTSPATTTAAGSTTADSGVCVDTFEAYPDTLSYGGDRQTDISDVDACLESCLMSDTCSAFDFTDDERCFLHYGEDYLNRVKENAPEVTQYRRQPCDSTPGSSVGTGVTQPCVDEFDIITNTFAYGGSIIDGSDTVEECTAACLADPACVAFDYNNANNKCWSHTDVDDLNNIKSDADDLDLYRRLPCQATPVVSGATTAAACEDTFDFFAGTSSFGGMQEAGVDTLDGCLDVCRANPECVGVDFNSANRCFVHTSTDAFMSNNLRDTPAIDQYRRNTCVTVSPGSPSVTQGECVDTYTLVANTLYFGGSDVGTTATAEECQALCTDESECLAIDYNRVNNKCYLHTTAENLVDSNRRDNAENVDHYDRVRCEASSPASASASITPSGCVAEFNMIPNQLSLGGTSYFQDMTLEDCKARCVAEENCLALDWDSAAYGIHCFLHFSQDTLDNTREVDNVDQYVLVSRCPTVSTAATTVDSDCTYLQINDRRADGGILQSGTLTEDACKNLCLLDNHCIAIDYHDDNSFCTLHYVVTPTVSDGDYTRYEKSCTACYDSFTLNAETRGLSGTRVDNVLGASACAMACWADSDCVAFDLNNNNDYCFHFSSNPTLVSANVVDHYAANDCEECQDAYIMTPNARAPGSQVQSGITDLATCQATCSATSTCDGFDYRSNDMCYFIFDDFDSLTNNNNYDNYLRLRCPDSSSSTSTTATTPEASTEAPRTTSTLDGCAADLVLIVDTSGSIEDAGADNWQIVKDFLKDLVSALDIGPTRTRVAQIIFSDYAEIRIDFNDHDNVDDLRQAIDNTPFIGGSTLTSLAFQQYRQGLLGNTQRGNRGNVPDLIILITDGNTTVTDRTALYTELDLLDALPTTTLIRRLGVGVGSINIAEMQRIVTAPFDTNYFGVDDFASLTDVLDDVLLGTECSGVTNAPNPVTNDGLALYVYRVGTTDSAMYPVVYPYRELDYNNNFNMDANVMTPPVTGVYWFSLSAGVKPWTPVYYELSGGPYNVAICRQTQRDDGYDTLSKDAILQLGASSTVRVNSQYSLYSDAFRQASLAAFSITDIMGTSAIYFMSGFTSGTFTGPGTLLFNQYPVDSSSAFNQANSIYVCPRTGLYVFSVGVYIRQGSLMQAELQVGSSVFELRRTHSYHVDNGDSLSRAVVAYCSAGSTAQIYISQGTIQGRSDYSTSFMGFLYEPLDSQGNIVFAVSRNTMFENNQSDQATLTVPFTSKDYQSGNINVPSSDIQQIQCQVTGLYYVSLTVQAAPNRKVNVYIAKDGIEIGGIYRASVWHGAFYDTLSRSAIIQCNQGSQLSVKIKYDSAIAGSSASNKVGTSFFGILLYRV